MLLILSEGAVASSVHTARDAWGNGGVEKTVNFENSSISVYRYSQLASPDALGDWEEANPPEPPQAPEAPKQPETPDDSVDPDSPEDSESPKEPYKEW